MSGGLVARSVGVYDFVGEHYRDFQARHHPDQVAVFGVPFKAVTDAYAAGLAMTVPATVLGGWSARAAGIDVLPRNRRMRARSYRVFCDDRIEPVMKES